MSIPMDCKCHLWLWKGTGLKVGRRNKGDSGGGGKVFLVVGRLFKSSIKKPEN